MHIKKIFSLLLFLATFAVITHAQIGNITATFTPSNAASKSVTFKFSKPSFKFNNPNGYWVTSPRTGSRHIAIYPNQGYGNADAAFISISENDNDFELYTGTSNDSTSISFSNAIYTVSAPKYDVQNKEANKPMKVHIVTFTPAEIVFTISGQANRLKREGYDAKGEDGTINATAHFYREAKYDKSDILPGCNCDPTIYATVFDEDNNIRTTSDCENALNQKVFDAVQKSMSPLFTNVKFNGNNIAVGEINITMIAGHTNIDVPVKDRPYCSNPNYHNSLTGIHAQAKYFSSDDKYGIRFTRTPPEIMQGQNEDRNENTKRQVAKVDSLQKLFAAKKITMEGYSKAVTAVLTNISSGSPDIKKLEVENSLYIYVILNPENSTGTDVKLADKNNTAVQHNIKGAAFEIFSGQIKENDGSWLSNRYNIYFGKYTRPMKGTAGAGFESLNTKAIYPATGNKLSLYNIVIKMEGAKDMIDKAVANINFSALQNLITKQ